LIGDFLNDLLTFIIAAGAVYFMVVLPVNKLMASVKKAPDPTTRKCAECLSDIPLEARRCKFCTATATSATAARRPLARPNRGLSDRS
jgi:large conductance mechanosensitive channel